MNKLFPVLVLVLVIAGGAYLYMKKYSTPAIPPTETTQTTTTPEAVTGTPAVAGVVKEFTVDGNEFAFAPSTLAVSKGDTVKVTFTNTGKYPHNFTIDALNVKGKTVQAGESDTVTFTADKAGTFQYYCSVPTHKDRGMVGTLTVQ